MHLPKMLTSLAAIALWPQAAAGQLSAAPIPSALPGVAKISAANAAGVLRYCEQNKLVSSTSADALLGGFAGKLDIKSPEYLAGLGGQIRGDAGKNFSIAGAPAYLRSQACSIVLEQAKSFPAVH
jgi:hypothetical protein